jgi:hypothetical protein
MELDAGLIQEIQSARVTMRKRAACTARIAFKSGTTLSRHRTAVSCKPRQA